MSLRFIRGNPVALRASGSLVALAFLLTLALSDAPRLHERLHHVLGPNHECAVTMMLSGSVDGAAITPAVIAPLLSTPTILVVPPILAAEPTLDFSILEHAPPARA